MHRYSAPRRASDGTITKLIPSDATYTVQGMDVPITRSKSAGISATHTYAKKVLGSSAKYLSSGVNGIAYVAHMTGGLQRVLAGISPPQGIGCVMLSRKFPIGSDVVFKCVYGFGNETRGVFTRDFLNEVWLHHTAMRSGANAVVPKIYCFWVDLEKDIAVVCMERIVGKHLIDVPATPKIFRRVERAVLKLWMAGIAHADLHYKQIIVRPNGNVIILDFGRAVKLDANVVRNVERRMKKSQAPDMIWRKAIERAVESEYIKRAWRAYYANGDFLAQLVEKVSRVP